MEAERGGQKGEKDLVKAHNEGEKEKKNKSGSGEFASTLGTQYREVQWRVFQQYFRTPSYIYSKIVLITISALFIGFSFFNAGTSQQGLQK